MVQPEGVILAPQPNKSDYVTDDLSPDRMNFINQTLLPPALTYNEHEMDCYAVAGFLPLEEPVWTFDRSGTVYKYTLKEFSDVLKYYNNFYLTRLAKLCEYFQLGDCSDTISEIKLLNHLSVNIEKMHETLIRMVDRKLIVLTWRQKH